ncbi:MAG: hypothetical protein ACO307_18745, partial [Ilumatobacteraceae bacterium]
MGTSNSYFELVAKFEATAKALGDVNPRAVGAACQVYKNTIQREVAKDIGPERGLSNWGSAKYRAAGGLRIGAGYDVKGRANAVGIVEGRPRGAWKVLEYGTQPHIIGLGKGATGRLVSYALSGGPNKRARGQLNRQLRKQKALFANTGPGSKSARGGGYSHPIARPIQHPGTSGKRT